VMDILTGNFLEGIATVLNWGLTIYLYVIIARAIISWVSPSPYNPIVQLYRLVWLLYYFYHLF